MTLMILKIDFFKLYNYFYKYPPKSNSSNSFADALSLSLLTKPVSYLLNISATRCLPPSNCSKHLYILLTSEVYKNMLRFFVEVISTNINNKFH